MTSERNKKKEAPFRGVPLELRVKSKGCLVGAKRHIDQGQVAAAARVRCAIPVERDFCMPFGDNQNLRRVAVPKVTDMIQLYNRQVWIPTAIRNVKVYANVGADRQKNIERRGLRLDHQQLAVQTNLGIFKRKSRIGGFRRKNKTSKDDPCDEQ